MANKKKVAAKAAAKESAAALAAAGVTFRPSWKQHLAWQALEDGETEEIVYGGAAGGGKSWLGATWKVYRRLRYAGSRGITARTVLKDIRESTLITFLEVLSTWGLKAGKDFVYNGSEYYIQFPNGSREVFKDLAWNPSDPDYQRLGSSEYTDAWIEEAGDGLPQKAAQILKSRIRWKLHLWGLIPKILLTCNPGYHWLREEYFFDEDDAPVVLRPDQKVIQALVTDNPDKEFVKLYKKSLEGLNDYDRARLLDGDWNAVEKTGGEMFPHFDTMKHCQDVAHRYDPEHPLHLTWDFNTAPYMTLNVWQIFKTEEGFEAVQLAEFTPGNPNSNTPATCRLFMASKFGQHQAEVFIYGDPAGKHEDTRSEKGHNDYTLVMKGLKKLPHVVKKVGVSAPSVNTRCLWIDAVFEKEEGGLRIIIDKSCKNTLQDYQKVKKGADGTKEKRRIKNPNTGVSYEPYGHTSDANEYFLCKAFAEQYKQYRRPKKEAGKPRSSQAPPPKLATSRPARSAKQRY